MYWTRAALLEPKELFLPYGVSRSRYRERPQQYRSRSYHVGGHTENLLVDEHRRAFKQGIPRPIAAPGLSVGAGTTIQVGYYSFYDSLTDERGPLSKGKAVSGSITRTWSALPTVVPEEDAVFGGTVTLGGPSTTIAGIGTRFTSLRPGDRIALSSDTTRFVAVKTISDDFNMTTDQPLLAGATQTITIRIQTRVTHLEIWVSVSGATPRLVMRRQLGVTGFTESTATLALGDAYPSVFDRMPKGTMNAIFHDRQVIAGNQKHRDTVYLSAEGFPERWEGLTVKTRNGEPVTALVPLRDMLLICTATTSYIMTGYTEDDIEVNVSEYELGCFAQSAWEIVDGRAWIFNRRSCFLFNGAWQLVMVDRATEFRENYLKNRLSYENGFAVHNPRDQTLQFHCEIGTGFGNLTPESWIADYSGLATPEVGGSFSQPNWTNDDQVPESAAYLTDPNTGVGKFYRGRCDGKVYVEDPEVIFRGTAIIRTKHFLLDDPGGTRAEGKKHGHLWTYMLADALAGELDPDDSISDLSKWVCEIWGGDEFAGQVYQFKPTDPSAPVAEPTPKWQKTHRGSYLTGTVTGPHVSYYAPKTTWVDLPSMVAGRGFTYTFKISNAKKWVWRGLGGVILPGPATRGLLGIALE